MILSLPVPGFITSRMQGAQREKMERVSSTISSLSQQVVDRLLDRLKGSNGHRE